ncbi:MAG: AbrB family transcriptional regulator [Proteobacteria bacterium]|nr:AbrB family transcriptional regulator [Pseudomonadota bacterium]
MRAQPSLVVTGRTLAAGLAGGVIFAVGHLPVPWLAGPMFAVALLALLDIKVEMPTVLRDIGFLFGSVSLGATVTPEALQTITRYPVSVAFLALSVFATVFLSGRMLEKVYGWDRPTAFLASVPGALSMVMALAAASSGDVRRIAIVQAVRLFALVIGLPLVINAVVVIGPVGDAPIVTPAAMLVLFLTAYVASLIFGKRIANPMFLCGMITSTLLHVTDLIPGRLPEPVTIAGMMLVGVFAGVRFQGATFRMVASYFAPALMVLMIALAICLVTAFAVYELTGLDPAAILVAFAPGGAEAMIMTGAAMGLDTLYVSTHHVLRTVGLNTVTPFFAPGRPDAEDE